MDTNVVVSAIFFGGKPAEQQKIVLLRHASSQNLDMLFG
jgi:hypothetical protein